MLDMLGFFGLLESPLQELPGVDGESIWAGDEVHLTSKFLERVWHNKNLLNVKCSETGRIILTVEFSSANKKM